MVHISVFLGLADSPSAKNISPLRGFSGLNSVHIDENEDEHFVVAEGTASMVNGDQAFEATAGAAISLRKGIPRA